MVVRRRQTIRLADWDSVLDSFLRANEMPVLSGAGSRSQKQAVVVAEAACDTFDETRKLAERVADAAIDELDELKKSPNLPVRRAKHDKPVPTVSATQVQNGRCFCYDIWWLETLFGLYTKVTAKRKTAWMNSIV